MLGSLLLVAAVAGAPALTSYPKARRSGDTLILAAGRTARVVLRVPLNSTTTRFSQVLVRTSGWAGLADVLPMGEITRVRDAPPSVDVALVVSANLATSAPKRGALRIIVNDQELGSQVGEITWRPSLSVEPAAGLPSAAVIEGDLRLARGALNMAVAAVGPFGPRARRNAMIVLGPTTAKWREPLVEVVRIQAQLQALRASLRAIALADGTGAEAAVRALATNRGASLRPDRRTFKRLSTQKALRRAGAYLIRLQLERAMGWVEALLESERLQRGELAQALVLRGAVLAAGGVDDRAGQDFGQASCLDPVARPPARPVFERDFERLGKPPACAKPLNAVGVSAVRTASDDGVILRVRVTFGPDPFNLIGGGTVQLYDTQGALITEQPATVAGGDAGDTRAIVADFFDGGTLLDPSGQIRVSATLVGPGRAKVADIGRPEPEVVAVDDESGLSGGGLPLWAWITIGVAAAGGVTALAVVLASGGDESEGRGIGPIDVRF